MSDIHVSTIDDLEQFRVATIAFAGSARERLVSAEQDLQRFLQQLHELLRRAVAEVGRRTQVVEKCHHAVARCERHDVVDCSPLHVELARARRALGDADERRRLVERHLQRVLEAGRSYQMQAQRLNAAFDQDVPRASVTLNRIIDQIRANKRDREEIQKALEEILGRMVSINEFIGQGGTSGNDGALKIGLLASSSADQLEFKQTQMVQTNELTAQPLPPDVLATGGMMLSMLGAVSIDLIRSLKDRPDTN